MPINTKPKVELPVGNQLTDKMLSFEAVQPLYTLNDLIGVTPEFGENSTLRKLFEF